MNSRTPLARRIWWSKNGALVSAKRRERYANDPEYREKCKHRVRMFYQNPEGMEKRKKSRKAKYWSNPELYRNRSKEWVKNNREIFLKREADRRRKNRFRNRLIARAHSLLLTDRYIREQLSKYSTRSMWEWSEVDIEQKRRQIVASREKRITPEKAASIRTLWEGNVVTQRALSVRFGVSCSLIHSILLNGIHFDPAYSPSRKLHNLQAVRTVLGMMNAAAEIKAYFGK